MKSDLVYITRKKISNFYEYMFKCKEKDIGCIISYFSGNDYYYLSDLWGYANINKLRHTLSKNN